MWFRRLFYLLGGSVGVHWRLNRRLFVWLMIFVAIGMVLAFTVVFNSKVTPSTISNNLLDSNLLRVIKPNIKFGALMVGRIFYFALFFALVFLVCLHRWTVWLAFPLALFKGFSFIVNMWWIVAKFGFVTGLVLFFFYLVWFIVLLMLVVAVIVYCLRACETCRRGGLRGGLRWREVGKSAGIFLVAVTILAFFEWVSYWLVLSKIVFIT